MNDLSFREDSAKARDTRWMHRSLMDWERARRRKQRGTVEQRIFDGLKRMIAIRSSTPAFADFNNRDLVESGNPHLFVLLRSNPLELGQHVLAVANFDDAPQSLDLGNLCSRDHFCYPRLRDLYSGDSPHLVEHELVVPPFGFYWLSDRTG